MILKEKLPFLPGYEGLLQIWAVLPSVRLVGGCVRDLLADMPVHDIDLATSLLPAEIQLLLQDMGIRVVPTGLEHGTVTAVIAGQHYEITTLRRDVETDGRHAVVAWTQDWREDASRRDFTINALSLDQNGQLYDYFGGVDDLQAGRVRFVGDAGKRIEEDVLRALRFFRLYARYGRAPVDEAAYCAIKQKKSLIPALSAERIASELLKILAGPAVDSTIVLMERAGVLAECLPSVEGEALRRLLACGHQVDKHSSGLVQAGIVLRLFALCPDPECSVRLKLSNAIRNHLAALSAESPVFDPRDEDDALRRLRVRYTLPVLLDRSWLLQARDEAAPSEQWDQWRERLQALSQPVFALSGRDVLALGLASGPEVGRWLKQVKCWWMAQGCCPDRAACLAWLKEQLSLC